MPISTARHSGRYGRYIKFFSWLIDLGMVNLAYFITVWLSSEGQQISWRLTWALLNLVFLLVLGWMSRRSYYRSTTIDQVVNLTIREVFYHAMIFVPALYFVRFDEVSWRQLAGLYCFMLCLLCVERVIMDLLIKHMRRKGYNSSTVVIVGGGSQAERLYDSMTENTGLGYRVAALFGPEPAEDSVLREIYAGPLQDLPEYMERVGVEEIYYCSDQTIPGNVAFVARACEAKMIPFRFVPQIPSAILGSFEMSSLEAVPVLTLMDTPLRRVVNRALKRTFDLVFSSAVLVVLTPLVFVPVAVAIKLSSPGPIFFRQKRTGLKGREFWCYKFRSMKVNAEADKASATREDPRKTRVGDFLRRSSIDELPQFWNVLRGDMSVVGPRPHMLSQTEENTRLVKEYMVRHAVRPGITGWAQVNGYRGPMDEMWKLRGRVEHDIWYIENWSFLLDLKIIAKTVINAAGGEENAF